MAHKPKSQEVVFKIIVRLARKCKYLDLSLCRMSKLGISNVFIINSCKIFDSVIASGTVIGGDSNIVSSYFATNCQIPDGSKIDN